LFYNGFSFVRFLMKNHNGFSFESFYMKNHNCSMLDKSGYEETF